MLRTLLGVFTKQSRKPAARAARKSKQNRAVRLGLEALESRCLPTASWTAPFFAPYVNTLENPSYNYSTAAQAAGVKNIAMGFITANSQGKPAWDGQESLGSAVDNLLHQQVNNLRALGGDVMISFGGATDQTDPELGMVIGNVSQLQAAYQQVITAYSLNAIDFDLEGPTLTADGSYDGPINTASIDERSAAIAGLQAAAAQAGQQLQVYFTLPAYPGTNGLPPSALYVVQSAVAHGVDIAGVNIMTMDYYDGVSYDGTHAPSMGATATTLAQDLFSQLKTIPGLNKTDAQLWHMVGITPQIGVNVPTGDQAQSGVENFTEADAQTVETFAVQHGIGRLSMWSLNKDQYVAGEGAAQIWEDSSGLPQQPFDYAKIFQAFAATPAPTPTPAPPPANHAPTIATAAHASAVTVTGTTTNLGVLGADDGGEANLSYTWTASGPASVTFNANGSNAAKNTTATFHAAGTYHFLVTVTDSSGLSATSAVNVTVNQTRTRIVVTPGTVTVQPSAPQQFTARAVDQFGNAMAVQPAFTWSVTGGGTISTTGLYKAPTVNATVTVRATAVGLTSTATVTVRRQSNFVATFVDSDDWGSGFTGYITITNVGNTAINGWTLQFNFAPNITNVWNAQLVSHVGTHYVIRNASWDATIAAGKSVSFGFIAGPDNPGSGPTAYVLNGQAMTTNQGRMLASFVDTDDWGTGFTGYITITNTTSTTINGWTLQFDLAANIGAVWNGQVVSQSGTHYAITNADWNGTLAPGQSISFGFTADSIGASPFNFVFNGLSLN